LHLMIGWPSYLIDLLFDFLRLSNLLEK